MYIYNMYIYIYIYTHLCGAILLPEDRTTKQVSGGFPAQHEGSARLKVFTRTSGSIIINCIYS